MGKLRNFARETSAKVDYKYIKGKYYNMDYSQLGDERDKELRKGMLAGASRIGGGIILIIACVVALMAIASSI